MKRLISCFMIATLLICVGVFATGCGKDKKELNLFNWSEYLPQRVIDAFEAETGIKVNYNTYDSNESMYAKVSQSPGTYDLVVASDYYVEIMMKQNMLEPINKANITLIDNIAPEHMDKSFDPGNVYTIPFMCGSALLAVNTNMVDFEIKSFADLWDPSLKDKIVVLDDPRAVIGIALKKLGYSFNETDPAKLEEAKAELMTLKDNIRLFDSNSPKSALISEEVAIGYVWNAEAVLANKENSAIQIVYPEEGVFLWQDNFAIPKGAKHKEYAEQFINFVLRPEMSVIISEEQPYTNPNKKAQEQLPEELVNNIGVYPPASVYEQGEYMVDVGDTTVLFDKIWTDFKQQ